jgi:hypothetical protein
MGDHVSLASGGAGDEAQGVVRMANEAVGQRVRKVCGRGFVFAQGAGDGVAGALYR